MTIFLFQNSLFVIICESRSYKRSKVQCGSRLVLCHSHQSPPPSLPPLLPSSWTSYFFSFPLLPPSHFFSWLLLTLDLPFLSVRTQTFPHLPQWRDPLSLLPFRQQRVTPGKAGRTLASPSLTFAKHSLASLLARKLCRLINLYNEARNYLSKKKGIHRK